MIRRLLVLSLLALVLAPAPADALVEPPPGWVHELQSEFGWARLDTAGDDLLVARRDRIELHRPGGQVELVAGYVAPQLVAWDPSTGDAVFTNADAQVRRVRDNVVTTVADFEGITGIDVGTDGTIWVTADGFVQSIAPDGTIEKRTDEASYLTTIVVTPDGDVVYADRVQLYRISDGDPTLIAGDGRFCSSRADPCGDEGPAMDAGFAHITSLALGDDGSIYLTEHSNSRIRVIRPDGIVHNLAGSYVECVKVERSDCIPGFGARSAIQKVVSLAFAGGDLYAVDEGALPWVRLLQVTRADQAQPLAPQGYRMIAADGGVFAFGWSPFHGSTGDIRLVSPIVAGRSNGAGGYWFVAGDGGVFTFGDARFYGSAAGRTSSPVVDMQTSDAGYWLLERNGTVHRFGDATELFPSEDPPPYAAIVQTPGFAPYLVAERPSRLPRLNVPVVAAHGTKSGNGIWYVASDGGVFTEGDAGFFGSTGAMRLNQPVLDLVPTPTERGYWLLAADGGVFTFGDAEFLGSMGAVRLNQPVVAGVAGPSPSG